MYNNYIWNLAPHFTRASAFLAPHVPGDTGTWRLKSILIRMRIWAKTTKNREEAAKAIAISLPKPLKSCC